MTSLILSALWILWVLLLLILLLMMIMILLLDAIDCILIMIDADVCATCGLLRRSSVPFMLYIGP